METTHKENNNGAPLLGVDSLSLELGGEVILQDVSFSLREKEILAVVGPNGAGKSSLLKTLLGIYTSAHGAIQTYAGDAAQLNPLELAKVFGYVPQQEERGLHYSVSEFIEMSLYAHGLKFGLSSETNMKVNAALESTGMAKFAGRTMSELSGGELQKVYLSAAFAQDSAMLLLDEPTSFLDPRYQLEIIQTVMRSVAGAGNPRSAIIVTHDLNLALSCAHNILALSGGAVAYNGPSADFCDTELIERIYGVQLRFAEDPATQRQFIIPPTLDIGRRAPRAGGGS